MSTAYPAHFYDGLTSKPKEAFVRLREPDALEVEVSGSNGTNGDRFFWPLEHGGMEWERTVSTLRITFGEYPRRVIISRDKLFIATFVKHMQYAGRRGVYDRVLSLARKGPFFFLLGLIVLIVAGYFWVLPFTAERMALLLPLEVDRQIGNASFGSVMLGLDEDSARSVVLQRFGDELELTDKFDLRFHFVHSDQVNAFAMPGGDIVVFSGIVNGMEHHEQLAALLAHEATHVDERHSMRMMVRQMAGYLSLSMLLGDVNAVVAVLVENADNIRNMSYSRNLETDADQHGMERMAAAGVDPQGMVQLLELLEAETDEVPGALSFLSSHPLTEDRIAKAQANTTKNSGPFSTDPELERLFDSLKAK
ncbi:MAG: M48 family metallopeptidase [Flavobacteriales bacterium]|nr:M48 family metallopeptidase [Flavobacteriales bacterium]MBK6550122.1 M48 family metallopeptidase [Flavobacteriales bacterium]MBK7113366.1 M48 family metallopeptidase [Flavobacteriales bacterium]MBK7619606.1 M48 family metallopeptidase [Flavobacteriales bacterium]